MIRAPAYAGRFYESDPEALAAQITACFNHTLADAAKNVQPCGRLRALISPHAGYMFSGPVASVGFSRLEYERNKPQRVILLGPKHTHHGSQFAVSSCEKWLTPFGNVDVDTDFCRRMTEAVPELTLDDAAHKFEHSLEVQLPFLQKVYRSEKFAIVPVALGYDSFADLKAIALALKAFLQQFHENPPLLLISSDFSHDTPKEEAHRLDGEVIEHILALSPQGFYDLVTGEDRSVCGLVPITILLTMLENETIQAKLLAYATSMDIMPHPRGVGYASISFEEK